MLAVISFVIFSGAMACSIGVIAMMIAPQWRRIASLAMGQRQAVSTPLATLVAAERRIAVRRWASQPVPAAFSRLREAA